MQSKENLGDWNHTLQFGLGKHGKEKGVCWAYRRVRGKPIMTKPKPGKCKMKNAKFYFNILEYRLMIFLTKNHVQKL